MPRGVAMMTIDVSLQVSRMPSTIRLRLLQRVFHAGALEDNREAIRRAIHAEGNHRVDVVVTPADALCGFAPEDLLGRTDFLAACDAALHDLAAVDPHATVLVGAPVGTMAKGVAVLRDGAVSLPADAREREAPRLLDVGGVRIAVLSGDPSDAALVNAREAGTALLIVLEAVPYVIGANTARRECLAALARRNGFAIAWVNGVGGRDEDVVEGASLLIDADGSVVAEAAAFIDLDLHAEFDPATRRFSAVDWPTRETDDVASLYACLVRGIRDYVDRNGFPGVVLGLSGGIDSALVLALAVDALGAQRVRALMLPSRHTSPLSLRLADEQAAGLGVRCDTLPIEPPRDSLRATLAPVVAGHDTALAEENLQARIRGILLMALSNSSGDLLLSTGNKSEVAVGYATLYGDMCGGYAPLKDVYKTLVYRLARWRNGASVVGDAGIADSGKTPIPVAVIERAPSAELRDGQTDQDSLPAYDELDAILEYFVEGGESPDEIVARGFDAATVRRVVRLVRRSEFKRRQAAPGPTVTRRAFARGWRYPISSGWD